MSNYSNRFTDGQEVADYEKKEYGLESYSSWLWEIQKPVLLRLVEAHRQKTGTIRLLDFACGTGRVLSFLENLADRSEGVDISPAMAERAVSKCRRSTVRVGNLCEEADLAPGKYNLITAFRFLLNAEPDLRESVLRQLRRRLDEEKGLLLVNMHGNAWSLRHLPFLYRRWHRKRHPESYSAGFMLEEMSPPETRALLTRCGFEVVDEIGFGLLPWNRRRFRALPRAIERRAAASGWSKWISVDLLYLCRPAPPPGSDAFSPVKPRPS